jgi:thymidylate synthase
MEKNKYILSEYDLSLKNIIETGFDINQDRTGVGTRCLFGLSSTYDVSERVPILTKRKVAWKSVVKEVLWYISGSININDLEKMGCNIWTPWKSKEFTDKHQLPEGSGGYLYGYNLIHFGGNIHNQNDKGFNQLDYVINTLKQNAKSRQACFTFWRPDTNNQAILPACHAFYSFIVSPDEAGNMKILNCHLFQRSCDYPIGVGMANLFTATLFMRLIAYELNMKVGMLYHSGAHCHVYHNAMEAAREYISRDEQPNSPILNINYKSSIYDYTPEDFELEDYNPLPAIKFPIAV